jgi:hypothetical protein
MCDGQLDENGLMKTVFSCVAVASAAVILSGCATKPLTPVRWSKAGGTQEMFMQDRYACLTGTAAEVSWLC